MKHPTGKPFLYFLAAGLLLVASIPLTSVLQPAATTFKSFILSVMVFVFIPFIFVPQLIFHFERRWIQHGSMIVAMTRTSWVAAITMACLGTGIFLAWMSLPWIVASGFGPLRSMTSEETNRAVNMIRAWDEGDRGDLSVLLAQLTWRWLPDASVNTALSQKVRDECGASENLDFCFQGLRALFAVGAHTPELAPVLVRLSERDPEVRASWKPLGFLLERGEIAHRYRSMFLDMLGVIGPGSGDTAERELVARLSDREERSRWAAAGALGRVDSPDGRRQADAFFAQNLAPLIDGYRVDPSRRLRVCLFLLRAELKNPEVRTLALDALNDEKVAVRSCGAFLLLTSGVASDLVEERLQRKLETDPNHYARDSFAAVLEILATPRARQALQAYTPWQPERIQKIKERWNDPYFRLFGELL